MIISQKWDSGFWLNFWPWSGANPKILNHSRTACKFCPFITKIKTVEESRIWMKRARKDAKSFRWSALQTVMLTMPFVGASVCEKMVNVITVNHYILFCGYIFKLDIWVDSMVVVDSYDKDLLRLSLRAQLSWWLRRLRQSNLQLSGKYFFSSRLILIMVKIITFNKGGRRKSRLESVYRWKQYNARKMRSWLQRKSRMWSWLFEQFQDTTAQLPLWSK